MRVLCLDIEGGFGGSSRSLYESVRHLDGDVEIEVWCRRDGPIRPRYAAVGAACRVMPDMPHVSSLPKLSRNLYAYGRFAARWPASRGFRAALAAAAAGSFDVVHFNHEGLFLLMRWLRGQRGLGAALTMHIRTFLPPTPFSRWQYRTIAETAHGLVFITENERRRTAELAGRLVDGSVIYNIVTAPDAYLAPDPELARDPRFKVAVLSNYAHIRGCDRMIDIARALAGQRRDDVLFVMVGDMALPHAFGRHAGPGHLADVARAAGVAGMFRFLGHVADPAPVLAACDMLAKPTREHNPWGRDILEAMAFAKPPITIGRYGRFVEDGVTGILHGDFEAAAWAAAIARLADDRAECARLGQAARERVLRLCDGAARAGDLKAVWAAACSRKSERNVWHCGADRARTAV